MTVTYYATCGAISPGPCTIMSGIDVMVPWHHNWANPGYWVMMFPIYMALIVMPYAVAVLIRTKDKND